MIGDDIHAEDNGLTETLRNSSKSCKKIGAMCKLLAAVEMMDVDVVRRGGLECVATSYLLGVSVTAHEWNRRRGSKPEGFLNCEKTCPF